MSYFKQQIQQSLSISKPAALFPAFLSSTDEMRDGGKQRETSTTRRGGNRGAAVSQVG